MTSIIMICALALLLAFSLYLAAKEQAKGRAEGAMKTLNIMEADFRPVAEPEPAPRPARRSQTWEDSPSREIVKKTNEQFYISPSLEKVVRRYAEQLRRVKKWEHYAAHAKKARTRKKYRNRLREYYSREPAFRPAGLNSGHGIDSTAGGWWLRTPSPGEASSYPPISMLNGLILLPPVLWNYPD